MRWIPQLSGLMVQWPPILGSNQAPRPQTQLRKYGEKKKSTAVNPYPTCPGDCAYKLDWPLFIPWFSVQQAKISLTFYRHSHVFISFSLFGQTRGG